MGHCQNITESGAAVKRKQSAESPNDGKSIKRRKPNHGKPEPEYMMLEVPLVYEGEISEVVRMWTLSIPLTY
ncbi:hypothetical protein CONPUDRAFT_82850 [Coniophora puteana RWD-64-598 SS2]|uniref:Uncharacterized protein n=1 Tax=Coniophora puteana (strain RWD-64-598) TaxID=741705 RepID=A0A5M3MNR9_CONPW|nr:uncharacterized protein CONPUDRAFT_82850 [Coniophora puteana RWD-64-598 SS2]EIW80809.1 hypothetical protein CONPUDRAFT_82850 [Coniophora puteana RWD-64-598 SS2]